MQTALFTWHYVYSLNTSCLFCEYRKQKNTSGIDGHVLYFIFQARNQEECLEGCYRIYQTKSRFRLELNTITPPQKTSIK
jgi:hypothetical protein